MSSQPPHGQGSWQQPPAGPPGQGPGGPPGPPPGPPGPPGPPPPGGYPPGGPPPGGGPPGGPPPPGGPGGPPPGGPGGPPPGGPGGPPGGPGGPPQFGPGEPPGKSKKPLIAGIIAAVVVLAGVGVLLYFLVFSGDDDEAGGDYCSLLEENKDTFEQLMGGTGDEGNLEDQVAILHDLRAAAPEEVADEWAQLDDPFVELEEALDEAGLSWSDVEDEVPPEVEDAVNTFGEDIESIDQSAISQTLTDHAKEECDVEVQVE